MIFWRSLVEIPLLVCNSVLSRNSVYDIFVSLIQSRPSWHDLLGIILLVLLQYLTSYNVFVGTIHMMMT